MLRGRIDRIDVHDDGRWAVLDYKTGEQVKKPGDAHRRKDKSWVDLQLPLYRLITAGFRPGEPELGYGMLGKDGRAIRFAVASWSEADLEDALEKAREVVRAVRSGAFWDRGGTPYDEIFKAIWGEGMVLAADGESA